MHPIITNRDSALSAILIAPDRALVSQFSLPSASLDAFQIVLEIKSYPTNQTLDIRLRQLQPAVVLVDVASDLESAVTIISHIGRNHRDISVVALDHRSGSDTILRVLRAGATEYLYSPFDPAATTEAVTRLVGLRKSEPVSPGDLGKIFVFVSVKSGSGASTLATQTAFALRRITSERVLLADFDLMGGTIGFYLKVNQSFSAADALLRSDGLNAALWTSMVATSDGLDILSAPLVPSPEAVEALRMQNVLDYARTMYDWIVLDLPVIFQRTSLLTIPLSDRTFLVSTSELPSLHLARRSITMLEQLGFPKDRFQVIVNRVNRRDGVARGDIEKLFKCPVYASFPNDYFSLHRAVTLGVPLSREGDLGKAIEKLAIQLSASLGDKKIQVDDKR